MRDTENENVLFISHTAADKPFAAALEALICAAVESKSLIKVRYSTSDEAGPQGGEQWREWIDKMVAAARTALIVVTPNALGKPWLLWEAGAVRGADLARSRSSARPGAPARRLIVSIVYGLTEAQCPEPLRGDQMIRGLDSVRMRDQFVKAIRAHGITEEALVKADRRLAELLPAYVTSIGKALLSAPSPVTEANVRDWLARLGALEQEKRLSELTSFERWMTLAFGRDGEGAGVPIDVRLHRRLGELYLQQKEFALAAEQLRLARWAAPRDIYVLRPLAEASMKRLLDAPTVSQDASDELEDVFAAIEYLDQGAFVLTPDVAALRGKYLRRVKKEPEKAIETYKAALNASGNSYYLADVLAQTQLEIGKPDEARASFERALEIINRLKENNIWSHATAATASLAIGDVEGVHKHLSAIPAIRALTKSESDTICGGLREVAGHLGVAPSDTENMLRALTGASAAAVQ